MAEQAKLSRERSEALDSQAAAIKNTVDTHLRPTLDSDVTAVHALRDMNENTVDMLAELNSGLDMLPEGGYMEGTVRYNYTE